MKANVMLDLETMGTKPNAAIVAIGAAKFDNGKVWDTFYTTVKLESSMAAGLSVDAGTIQWWMKQDVLAQTSAFNDRKAQSLSDALSDLAVWIGPGVLLWGNGADFDNVILRSAYEAIGRPAPWGNFDNRCYRTVKNLYPAVAIPFVGIKHNALADAEYQANHLIKILKAAGL